MSIKIKNKKGLEVEYVHTEKQADSVKTQEEDCAVIKTKEGIPIEYVHSSQVEKEEMERLLHEAEVRQTVEKNKEIEHRIQQKEEKEAEKEQKKKAAEQRKLEQRRHRAARNAQNHADWLNNIEAVRYLGADVVGGETTVNLKKGSAIFRATLGSFYGPIGAVLGAASAKQEIRQTPIKVFHKFFVIYRDGSSDTMTVKENSRKYHDLMSMSMK